MWNSARNPGRGLLTHSTVLDKTCSLDAYGLPSPSGPIETARALLRRYSSRGRAVQERGSSGGSRRAESIPPVATTEEEAKSRHVLQRYLMNQWKRSIPCCHKEEERRQARGYFGGSQPASQSRHRGCLKHAHSQLSHVRRGEYALYTAPDLWLLEEKQYCK